jgi:putative tryptophan/tyrosine transport system substrate-binding protein
MVIAIGRREFIAGLGGAVATWPLVARAQNTTRMARIGYLTLIDPSSADDALLQGLRDLGWVEGQNMLIERRLAAGDRERLKKFAAELVELKVDIIVAVATAAVSCRDTDDHAN